MPKKGEFQVHGMAAGKRPRKAKPEPEPVKVVKVNPVALRMAREMAEGKDMHIVINSDGSVEVRNGGK